MANFGLTKTLAQHGLPPNFPGFAPLLVDFWPEILVQPGFEPVSLNSAIISSLSELLQNPESPLTSFEDTMCIIKSMQRYFPILESLFSKYQEIKLVYLFGSQATRTAGPNSDYDFAVYLDPTTEISIQKDILLSLIADISSILKNDKVDIVLLNQPAPPLLKYNIIKDGILIFQRAPYKIVVEPEIYSQYFDFQVFMQKHES